MSLRFARSSRYVWLFVAAIGLISLPVAVAQSDAESIYRPSVSRIRIAAAQSSTVKLQGFQFQPSALTVKRGTTVTFVNKDATPHTVTAEKGAKFTGTGRLQKNDSKKVVFNQVGEYNYFCEIHPSMKGKIKVIN
jgi:plastocyanin